MTAMAISAHLTPTRPRPCGTRSAACPRSRQPRCSPRSRRRPCPSPTTSTSQSPSQQSCRPKCQCYCSMARTVSRWAWLLPFPRTTRPSCARRWPRCCSGRRWTTRSYSPSSRRAAARAPRPPPSARRAGHCPPTMPTNPPVYVWYAQPTRSLLRRVTTANARSRYRRPLWPRAGARLPDGR